MAVDGQVGLDQQHHRQDGHRGAGHGREEPGSSLRSVQSRAGWVAGRCRTSPIPLRAEQDHFLALPLLHVLDSSWRRAHCDQRDPKADHDSGEPAVVGDIVNGSFEDGLTGWWIVSGAGFWDQPVQAKWIGARDVLIDGRPAVTLRGDYWHTTAFPLGQDGPSLFRVVTEKDGAGILNSVPFMITQRCLAYRLGGTAGYDATLEVRVPQDNIPCPIRAWPILKGAPGPVLDRIKERLGGKDATASKELARKATGTPKAEH